MRRLAVGAAAGIAGVTIASRVVGFGRTGVLARTLGTSCVGDTYSAANAIPNVVFEVVAGGALAGLVVPVLAGAVAAGDRETAGRTTSALLTWTVLVLTPVALLGLVLAPYLLRAVVGTSPSCGRPMLDVGGRMLLVFLPQVVLYGIGIVLAGVLQAHRRFLGPAVAPLLSSFVVITAYLLYAAQGRTPLADLSRAQELTLSAGTTLGVAVLSLGLLVPLRRCDLPLRPTLAFPEGVAAKVRRLAVAGVAGLAAQQLALVVALRLAAHGAEGSIVVFQVATALFLLPWAVLAVPIATSAFPDLAASDGDAFADRAARALVAVLVSTLGGAVVLASLAHPAARVLVDEGSGRLARAVIAFAPGLVGYGLLALVSRTLYARGDGRTAGVATVAGWVAVAVVDVVLVATTDLDRVVALGIGNTAGMTLAAALLLAGLHRVAPRALRGSGRTTVAGLAGCLAAGVVALLVPSFGRGVLPSLLACAVVGVLTTAVYAVVVRLVQPSALRELVRA
ncbi:MAG: virulence factor MviN [Actinobacteria bacterium]|nr:virulence factor MviN [Actinomycetota bacterium]MCA1720201.1 virulence factor MviN [Actinomycetota bacterium]